MASFSSTTIIGIKVNAVCVPMEPHLTASGPVTESPLVLIDVILDNGVTGHGILFTYTKIALKPVGQLVLDIGNIIKGEVLAPFDLSQKLTRRFRLLGTQGLIGMAIAGIDMALWDALARSYNTSLMQLLGASEKPVAAYGAIGFDGVKDSVKASEKWVTAGFTGVKAKIGYPTVKEDLNVIKSIRKTVGENIAIMVDYNQSLTPTEAIQRIKVLDQEEKLTWVEEPTLAHDYAGHAFISREVCTPIQCGENWWGVLDMQHAIDAQASDYMMLDVMKIGGVTGWVQAASLAFTKGIRLSNHLWPEISAQLLCATLTAGWNMQTGGIL